MMTPENKMHKNILHKDIYDDITSSLCDLIKIPSVKSTSTNDAPFGQNTLKALEYMLKLGESLGFLSTNLDGYAGFIDFPGTSEKQVAILCHLDVVPADKGWDTDPFEPSVLDGKITGRGTADDKGPAIACLYAMKALKDEGFVPPCSIRLILGLDEESGSLCMEHYKKKEKLPDIGFTPDAKFPVIYAEKGILHLTLEGNLSSKINDSDRLRLISINGGERANMIPAECEFSYSITDENNQIKIVKDKSSGKPGHASLPEYGENAISKALNLLADLFVKNDIHNPLVEFFADNILTETNGESFGIAFSDDKSGALTCNVGLINFEDNLATITFDIRYPVTCQKDNIIDTIKLRADKYGLDIKNFSGLDPVYKDPDSGFVQTLLKVYEEVTGTNSSPIAIGGGTYARSIPGIIAFGPNFDPKDDVAHQSGEYIKLDDLFLCYEIYKKAIEKLCFYITE